MAEPELAGSPPEGEIGARLAGRYAHRQELGRGALGRVIRVFDELSGGDRAAKVVPPADGERLGWEHARLLGLSHPGLTQVHELLRVETALGPPFRVPAGSWVLIEELADGLPADRAVLAVDEDDAARVLRVARLGRAVADALAAVHAAGLVHGDVKPANIVAPDDPDRARLVDLGLARPPGVDPGAGGTPRYLSPEAWLGERSGATDLFALGVTLARLLSGRTDDDSLSGPLGVGPGEPLDLAGLPDAVPAPMRRLLSQLVSDEAALRPGSAGEVAQRLAATLSSLGVDVPAERAVSAGPSAEERAMRVGVVPRIGPREPFEALVASVAEPGVVAVVGPPGVGRSRWVRDAVRVLQEREGAPATYVAERAGVERPPVRAARAVVHREGASAGDVLDARREVRAAAVEGQARTVVLELESPPADAARVVELAPLGDDDFDTLLEAVLGSAPAAALRRAAAKASGQLAGRLCRQVAALLRAGLDPTRPDAYAHPAVPADARAVPAEALPLAEVLAVLGEGLTAPEASRVVPEAPSAGPALRAAGLAVEDARGRLVLRPDVALSLRRALGAEGGRRVASRFTRDVSTLPAAAQARVALFDGEPSRADQAFRRALDDARAAGAPERAVVLGREALDALGDAATPALRRAVGDALRATARENDALALLDGLDDAAAAALRAELLRLLGRADDARVEASSAGELGRAVGARLALDRGAPDEALRLAADEPDAEDRARRAEVRAWAALSAGDVERARLEVDSALRTAEGDPAAEARALSLRGSLAVLEGRPAEARAFQERAFTRADRAGERLAAASFLVNLGLSQLDQGELGPALASLREGARRLVALDRTAAAARALYNLGGAAALIGDDDLAEDALRRAREAGDEVGDAAVQGLVIATEAELALRAGKVEAASRRLAAAPADVPDPVAAILHARRALVAAIAGDRAAAEAALDAGDALDAPGSGGRVELALARVRLLLASGLEPAALEAAQALEREVAGHGFEARLRTALLSAEAHERGGASGEARGRHADARGLLDRAAATLSPSARARLRSVPAYQRAWAVAAPTSAAPDSTEWRAFATWSARIARETRVAPLASTIVDAALELGGAERGFLVERRPDGTFRWLAAQGLGQRLPAEQRPSLSVVTRVLDGGRPLVTTDAAEDVRLEAAASVHRLALRSVLAVPVDAGEGRAAVLYLDDRLRRGAFDAPTVERVRLLAAVAGSSLAHAEQLRTERRRRRELRRQKDALTTRLVAQSEELLELRRRSAAPVIEGIVAESEPMRRVLRLVARVAQSDAPVLVLGESGTGKELVARAIHDTGPRAEEAFVSENCGAIPETLLETTLFGHVRGAFTGAQRARRGLFEVADGGTLFLDEIGEMSLAMQAKLLRVLQDGELRPVGGERSRKVDVRILAATHQDLEKLVDEGRFRADLYYRVAVVRLSLPALRDRPGDIPALVGAFLERHREGGPPRRLEPEAMAALRAFRWPGNVRQLENEVRRALVLSDDVIEVSHLSPAVRGDSRDGAAALDELDLKGQIDALERRLIRRALKQTSGNQTRASELLGVSRYGLQKMMKRLGVARGDR